MLEHEGRLYARVSDILKPFSNFDGIDPNVLSNKAQIGTNIHQAIHDEVSGEMPIVNEDNVGYFKSFKSWREALLPKFFHTEKRYFDNEKMVTGQIDALITLPGSEEPLLIDYKTSVQESPTWIMQAHLYYDLVAKSGLAIAQRCLFVKLHKFGMFPMVFEYKINKNMHAKCMKAVDDFWKNHTK